MYGKSACLYQRSAGEPEGFICLGGFGHSLFLPFTAANTHVFKEVFLLAKMLFRTVLFMSENEALQLTKPVFSVFRVLIERIAGRPEPMPMELLQNMPRWVCCLTYDNRNHEIGTRWSCSGTYGYKFYL